VPAHVVVYYVLAMALYMNSSCREVLRCLLEGLQWLRDPFASIKPASKSGISQARVRLGSVPIIRLHDEIVRPIATQQTRGAWYKCWRLISIDGSTMDVADTPANETAFGRSSGGRGDAAFPQVRFVSLIENGAHVLFSTKIGGYKVSEIALAATIVPHLIEGMLCLADRNFFGYKLWRAASAAGADLLWRIKNNLRLPREKVLDDGSYLRAFCKIMRVSKIFSTPLGCGVQVAAFSGLATRKI
jgi:hypothetical protein